MSIGTPGQTEEDGVIRIEVPQHLDTGACDWVPQADGMIQSTTGEPTAIRTPRDAVHAPAMPAQHPPRTTLFHLPQPDRVVKTAAGQRASIRAPGQDLHSLRMPHQRLEHTVAWHLSHLPELDGAIITRAGKLAAVGGKGQPPHPV